MTDQPQPLSPEALAEIEAVMSSGDSAAMYMTANVDNVRALCQSLRAAWTRIEELEQQRAAKATESNARSIYTAARWLYATESEGEGVEDE